MNQLCEIIILAGLMCTTNISIQEGYCFLLAGEPVVRVPPPPDDKVSDTLQTYHSSESDKDAKGGGPQMQPPHDISGLSSQATLESLSKSFSYLKKAVVIQLSFLVPISSAYMSLKCLIVVVI